MLFRMEPGIEMICLVVRDRRNFHSLVAHCVLTPSTRVGDWLCRKCKMINKC